MEKFKVTLAEEERQALELLVSAGKAAARKLAHAACPAPLRRGARRAEAN